MLWDKAARAFWGLGSAVGFFESHSRFTAEPNGPYMFIYMIEIRASTDIAV